MICDRSSDRHRLLSKKCFAGHGSGETTGGGLGTAGVEGKPSYRSVATGRRARLQVLLHWGALHTPLELEDLRGRKPPSKKLSLVGPKPL